MSAQTLSEQPPAPRWLGVLGWTVMALLSIYVAIHGISYLAGEPAPPVVEDNGMGMTMLMVHAGVGGIALLIGPLQFLSIIRNRAPKAHRWIGRTYMACAFISGAAGGLLAPFTAAGPIAASGFLLAALVWLWINAFGWRAAAIKRDFRDHKAWMIRSFAVAFAAVTLRLYLPIAGAMGLEFVAAYQWIAWLCWVPNLIIAEVWIMGWRSATSAST